MNGLNRDEILKLRQMARMQDTGEGRSLNELKKTKDILKGQESTRLRSFCTSNCMEPQRDLNAFGKLLMQGNLESIIMDHGSRVDKKMKKNMEFEAALQAVATDLAGLKWGPTEVPLYNLLGLFSLIVPHRRSTYLSIAQFYIVAKVSVNTKDLSGSSALSHCFSTKPGWDLEYAQLLLDAGGDVNSRNRYGATVAHEIVQVYDFSNPVATRKATQSFEWFLLHGGNVDIADGDGWTPRMIYENVVIASRIPEFSRLAQEECERRKLKDACCSTCGRDGDKLLDCSKCKQAKYCDPRSRACQTLDWPQHKKVCVA